MCQPLSIVTHYNLPTFQVGNGNAIQFADLLKLNYTLQSTICLKIVISCNVATFENGDILKWLYLAPCQLLGMVIFYNVPTSVNCDFWKL